MSTATVTDGATVVGTGDSVQLTLPAKEAGDLVQYVIITPGRDATTNLQGGTGGRVSQSGGLCVWRNVVGTTSGAGAQVNFKFPNGDYVAFAQIIHAPYDEPEPAPALVALVAAVATSSGSSVLSWETSDPEAFGSFEAKCDDGSTEVSPGPLTPDTRSFQFDGLVNQRLYTFSIQGVV